MLCETSVLTLTDHEGGVSLKGIKRTLPFSLLLLSTQGQLAICKRLSETKRRRAGQKQDKDGKRFIQNRG